MYTATITSKGQLTFPAPLRKQLNLKPTDKLSFTNQGQGVYVQRIPSIQTLFGSLNNPNVKPLSIKEIKQITDGGLFSDKYNG